MFLLRRTALRAAASAARPTPSLIVPKTRTFVSLNQSRLRPASQRIVSSTQRRFASDDAATAEKATEEATENEAVATEPVEAAVETVEEKEVLAEDLSNKTETPMEASTIADAAAAVASASGVAAATTAATEKPTQSPYAQAAGGLPTPNKAIYVGNLFFEVNDQSLADYFARFGQINKSRVVYDTRGLSKGFGYVEFEDIESAVRAVETANQQVFQGRRLAVQFHRPRVSLNPRASASPVPTKTLFIGNMSFEMSDKDLSDLFREVRNVIDVRIAIDRRSGQPRGFAHADFIDVASAKKALEHLRGKELYGRALRVDFSVSNPRAARERQEARQETRQDASN